MPRRLHTLEDIEELEEELTEHVNEVHRRLKELQEEKAKLQRFKSASVAVAVNVSNDSSEVDV